MDAVSKYSQGGQTAFSSGMPTGQGNAGLGRGVRDHQIKYALTLRATSQPGFVIGHTITTSVKSHIIASMKASFHITRAKVLGKRIWIPFLPGLARMADATIHLVVNLFKLIAADILLGIGQALCCRGAARLKNIPARLILLFRNSFHLIAGAALLVPFAGGALARGVYKLQDGIGYMAKAATCFSSRIEKGIYLPTAEEITAAEEDEDKLDVLSVDPQEAHNRARFPAGRIYLKRSADYGISRQQSAVVGTALPRRGEPAVASPSGKGRSDGVTYA